MVWNVYLRLREVIFTGALVAGGCALALPNVAVGAEEPPEPARLNAPDDSEILPALGGDDHTEVVTVSAEQRVDGPSSSSDEAETAAPEAISAAQRIGRLQRAIEKDQAQLEQLRLDLKEADEEFALAGKIYNKVEERLASIREKLKAARTDGKPEKVAELTAERDECQEKWNLCKERFDLAHETRQGLQQQISAIKEKIDQDIAALAKLTGANEGQPSAAPAKPEAPAAEPHEQLAPAAPADASASTEKEKTPAPAAEAPVKVVSTSPAGLATATKASVLPEGPAKEQALADVREARDEAERQRAAATEARDEVVAIEKRQQALDKNIALEQQLRDAARKQADNALRAAQEFQEDYRQKSEEGAAPEVLITLGQRIQSAELRVEKAREEVRHRTARLDELVEQRHALMSERIAALQQAEARQRSADEAQRKVAHLENPFSGRNISRWLLEHGPNVVVILVCFFVVRLGARIVSRRVVVLMTHKGNGSRKERENRAHTIVGVFHNAATVLCYGGSTLMILEECGVPVGPLLGGAAVLGLAVAFGSQNLIRDYFYGFVILLENQYGINDVVRIGDVTGKVERITLRMTVIRDQEGVNFIPNGRIESVKNLTHGWSQAVLEIRVSYEEDVDRVMDVLMNLGRELRKDPAFADAILEDPTMLGVENLGDSSVVVKFFIKTKPLEQWGVRREMLRRIKRRFDELAIEIPLPQQVVSHRRLTSTEPSASGEESEKWTQRRSA